MLPTEFRTNKGFLFRVIDTNQANRKCSLAFGSHWHHEIEIVVMRHGQCNAYLNSEVYHIEDNSIFIVFPNQIHTYLDPYSHKQDYYVLMFSPSLVPQFDENFQGLVPQNPLFTNIHEHPYLSSLLELIYKVALIDNVKNVEILQGLLFAFFSAFRQTTPFVSEARKPNSTINRVIQYCSLHYKEDISLAQMAKDLGISAPHLSRLFVKKLQINFNTYVNILRISEAQGLLTKTTLPVQTICKEVGFSCVRSFNRAFSNVIGITPTEYRKQL